MSEVLLVCSECKAPFGKKRGEFNRRKRLGQDSFFCSNSCQVTAHNRLVKRPGRTQNLRAGRKLDDASPFRWFMRRVTDRVRKGPSDLTVDYLQRLWLQQAGVCPFTGWKMILPDSTWGWRDAEPSAVPQHASLDRIDNKFGYVVGNVRFISRIANLARATFTDEQLIEFCKAVAYCSREGRRG